jgi:hypothetical protein
MTGAIASTHLAVAGLVGLAVGWLGLLVGDRHFRPIMALSALVFVGAIGAGFMLAR